MPRGVGGHTHIRTPPHPNNIRHTPQSHPPPTNRLKTKPYTFWQVEPPLERILRPDRVYVIDVEMRVPESPANAALGNWMVQVGVWVCRCRPSCCWDDVSD